jgi:hypothetical protein
LPQYGAATDENDPGIGAGSCWRAARIPWGNGRKRPSSPRAQERELARRRRGDSCNIPRFYQILGGIFLLLFCLRCLEIHRDLKLFESIWKALLENYFKLSINSLKNFLEKDQVSKYYFPFFIQTYASLFAKE